MHDLILLLLSNRYYIVIFGSLKNLLQKEKNMFVFPISLLLGHTLNQYCCTKRKNVFLCTSSLSLLWHKNMFKYLGLKWAQFAPKKIRKARPTLNFPKCVVVGE